MNPRCPNEHASVWYPVTGRYVVVCLQNDYSRRLAVRIARGEWA
jgi:hypothetical protein